ncbi:MAG: DciA family protein [Usitatibacter sp.]
MAAESISRLLGDNAELRPLSERLLYIKRLQKRYRTLAPGKLADASRVCAIDGTTVVIRASSGAVAAALRHVAPRLLEGLRAKTSKHSRDQELTAIRIEVQVDVPTPKVVAKPRGDFPRAKLGSLAEQMSDSPLKDELMRIGAQSSSTRSKT